MNEYNKQETNESMNHGDPQAHIFKLQTAYQEALGPSGGERLSVGEGERAGSDHAKGPKLATMLAAFLAGAVLVGGFSYGADKLNLFSGGRTIAAQSQGSGGSPSGDAGMTTASVALGADANISSVYNAANPAVVKIENYATQTSTSDNLFGGRGMSRRQPSAEPTLVGEGSGFFFVQSGYILTNEHVVADATELKVTVQGYDEPLTAKLVGSDAKLDLAVLKVESPDGLAFPSLALGDSDRTKIGEWVVAIGNPYGFDHTITIGVLSAKERPITINDEQGEHVYEHLLQTDASINPGNSGGPLLNAQGEVVGINTAVNSEAQGIGFAIPTKTIKEHLNKLMGNQTAIKS